MKAIYAPFDPAEYLDDEVVVAEYLTTAAEDTDPDVFLAALGNVAKARGMAEIAKESGLGRESLYKALSAGAHPRFETVSAVLRALGVKLNVAADQLKPTTGLRESNASYRAAPSHDDLVPLTAEQLNKLYRPVGEIIVQWALTDTNLHHLAFAMFKAVGTSPHEQKWPVMFGPRLEIIEKLFSTKLEFNGLAKAAAPIIKDIKHLQVLRDMLVHGAAVRYSPSKDAILWHRIDRSTKEQRLRNPAITHNRNTMLVRYSMLAEASDGCFSVNTALLALREKVLTIASPTEGLRKRNKSR